MPVANANLVLVAALGDVAKLLLKHQVSRRRLLSAKLEFKGSPWRRAEGGDHIHGRLHARLREGDGRLASHIGVDRHNGTGRRSRVPKDASVLQGGVARVPRQVWRGFEALGDRVCFGRNVVSG